MMDPTAAALQAANRIAQQRFREMLDAGAYSDPNHELTRAYIASERLVDEILVDAQWETAKEGLDRLQARDTEDLSLGDHFVGMPR